METIGTGEGKSKFGWGVYLTSAYATAVLYSGKGPGREAEDHYVYSVEIPDDDRYFILHKPVPEQIADLAEAEVGTVKDPSALEWGNDFRAELEEMLFMKNFGHKPKDKKEDGLAQKLFADWLYAHGFLGLAWPQSSWPKRGEDKQVDKLNIAMFSGEDIRISMIERVEVAFVAKQKSKPDKLTCMEVKGSERKVINPEHLIEQ